ncbi:sensor histidine kinase [Cellulomonas citrea]|uniref:sensor histidine kinase n=1 Tax=Cellulomonas citrea TaxID=1909423 RepID=UPI0013569C34|nr:hypothetical protein [Cellulomonas citrea]
MAVPLRRRDVVDAGLRHAVSGALILSLVAVGVGVLPRVWSRPTGEGAATVALLGLWLVVGVRLLRGHGGRGTALLLAVAALVPLAVLGGPAPEGVPPILAVAPTVLAVLAAVLLLPRGALIAVLVMVAQLLVALPRLGLGGALVWLWLPLALGVMAYIARDELRAAADRADAAVQEQRAAEVALVGARARARVHSSWQGMLHDEVAAALRAAATPGLAGVEVRRYAARAVAAVERVDVEPAAGQVDVMPAIRDLADTAFTPVDVRAPDELVLPSRVAAALAGAVSEVLRNVDRHAGAALVRVQVERTGAADGDPDGPEGPGAAGPAAAGVGHAAGAGRSLHGLRVVVTDDGAGFAVPTSLPAGGLRVSVVERLAQVGGRAQVTSSPGAGTRVTLWWPDPERVGPAGGDGAEPRPAQPSRLLSLSPLPLLAAAGVLALVDVPDDGTRPFAVAWFAVLTVLTVATALRADRPLPRGWVAAVLVVACGGALWLLKDLTPYGWGGFGPWPLVAVGPLLLIVGMRGAVASTVTALLATHLGVWVLGLRAGARPDLLLMVLLLSSLVVGIGLRVRTVMWRLAAVAGRAEDAAHEQIVQAWDRSVARAVRARRRARLQVLVLPFLNGLVDGSLSTRDPAVRAEAALLEQSVRDELHLPEVLDDDTRAAVRRARTAGCRVRVQADEAPPPPHDLVCAVVVAALGDPLPRELTVSVYARSDPPTLAVVAVPGDAARAAALEQVAGSALRVIDDAPEGTWAEVRIGRRAADGRRTMTS